MTTNDHLTAKVIELMYDGHFLDCDHIEDHDPYATAKAAELIDLIVAAERERWTTVLADLTDPDPCWFDHHGGCQAHGFISLRPGEKCPQAHAKELLAEAAIARGGQDGTGQDGAEA